MSACFIKNIWDSTAIFLQNRWEKFIDTFDNDYYHLYVHFGLLWINFLYISIGGFLTYTYLYKKIRILEKCRINQKEVSHNINRKNFKKVFTYIMINMTIVSYFATFFLFKLKELNGFQNIRKLPSIKEFLISMPAFAFIEEFLLYYIHRLLHHKLLYKYCHKVHHELDRPIAITATYAHPLDFLLTSIIPVFCGPCIFNSHEIIIFVWISFVTIHTLNDHCGYHFPILIKDHYDHHLFFNCNYGSVGIFDYLHGTKFNINKTIKAINKMSCVHSTTGPTVKFD